MLCEDASRPRESKLPAGRSHGDGVHKAGAPLVPGSATLPGVQGCGGAGGHWGGTRSRCLSSPGAEVAPASHQQERLSQASLRRRLQKVPHPKAFSGS